MKKLLFCLSACLASLVLMAGNPPAVPDPSAGSSPAAPQAPKADNPLPPSHPVKLIFIHHSTGNNWLSDSDFTPIGGDLGEALMQNNYFVSGTDVGWGPDSIGDRTDIGQWWDWFRGPQSATYTAALYTEYDQNNPPYSSWPRLATDPGGENQVILFKSCYPNSSILGSPTDPPTTGDNPMRGATSGSDTYTVANAKGIYNDLLVYFATRQDKLFILITPPPLMQSATDASRAANARALNDWLVNDWLDAYPYNNVAVFDLYNVLTSNGGNPDLNDVNSETGNHHRWWNGAVQHIQTVNSNYAAYPVDDSHPTYAGNQKATAEFVQLLNVYYHRWADPNLTHTLALSTSGIGSVTQNPTGNSFSAGTVVRLTPVPGSGYQFAGWGGASAGDPVNNGDGSWSLSMNSDKTLVANFTLIPNVAPLITGQVPLSTNEDTPLTITLNDLLVTDPDDPYPTGFTLTVGAGAHYSVLNNTITPEVNFNGTLSVPLVVNDGTDNSPIYIASVQVLPVNDTPVCSALMLTTLQDYPLQAVPACTDVDSPVLTYSISVAALHGTAAADADHLVYTPAPGYTGADSFTYQASDGVLASAPAVVTVHVLAAVTHTIDLLPGWNLVSFNIHPLSTALADVLQGAAGNYDLVYAWDATAGNWLKADNIPISPDTLTTLDETRGFWIHMLAADQLVITGSAASSTTIQLIANAGGWNLVGYPSASNRGLPDALSASGLGSSPFIVFTYLPADIISPWKIYDRSAAPYANTLPAMLPGLGYWIHVSGLANWSVWY